MRIVNSLAIEIVNLITAKFLVGGVGRLDWMTGTQPANADVAISAQQVVGSSTLNGTPFPAAVDATDKATATANAIAPVTATLAGTNTVTWFRAYDGAGAVIEDGSAGTSGTDAILNNASFELDDSIEVNSFTITMPEF